MNNARRVQRAIQGGSQVAALQEKVQRESGLRRLESRINTSVMRQVLARTKLLEEALMRVAFASSIEEARAVVDEFLPGYCRPDEAQQEEEANEARED